MVKEMNEDTVFSPSSKTTKEKLYQATNIKSAEIPLKLPSELSSLSNFEIVENLIKHFKNDASSSPATHICHFFEYKLDQLWKKIKKANQKASVA